MKILFCIGSMHKGGAERVISNLSNEFIKKNDVSIVPTSLDAPMYYLDPRITYYALDDNNNNSFLLRNFKRIKKLRAFLRKYQPDIIVSFLPEPTFRVMIAKKFLNIKTIISVRNDPNVEYDSFFRKLLVKWLYTSADGFVFQTRDAQKWFSLKIQKKSIIIPNPINEDFICKPFNGKREKTIVTVGRLTEQKNHKLLIDAFYEVHKIYSDYKLKIYGSGELYNQLQKQIKDLNLEKYVFLEGEVNDIKNVMYKAEMFVLSSNYEGMPNALMEAMALGLPCISTNCPIGGPKYLIQNNKNGILIDTNNKEELINKIIFYIENKEISENYGNEANKVCEMLNPKKINNLWRNYIDSILISNDKKDKR